MKMKTNYKVTGMSCKHCVARVTEGLEKLPGIEKVKVNLKKEQASVKFDDSQVTDAAIIATIQEIGYEAEVM